MPECFVFSIRGKSNLDDNSKLIGRQDLAKQAREIFNKALIDAPAQKALAISPIFLNINSVSGYLVGGFVRTHCWVERRRDIDIAVGADVLEIGPQLADSLQGKFVLLWTKSIASDGLSCRIGPSMSLLLTERLKTTEKARFHHQCHGRGFAATHIRKAKYCFD